MVFPERKTTEMKRRKKWEKKRLVIACPLKIRIFIHISSSDCTTTLQRMVIFISKMDLLRLRESEGQPPPKLQSQNLTPGPGG